MPGPADIAWFFDGIEFLDEAVEKDGTKFLDKVDDEEFLVSRVATPWRYMLQQSLEGTKDLYEEEFGQSVEGGDAEEDSDAEFLDELENDNELMEKMR